MTNVITPSTLMESIKNFGGSNAKFEAALAPASNKNFQHFSKKNLQAMDDCVREEAAFNLVFKKILVDENIKIGNKEKTLVDIAYKQFRQNLLNKNIDVALYDEAYQELLTII